MDPYTLEQLDSAEPQGLHAIMRFLRVLNRRKFILIGLIAIGAFLAVVRHRQIPKQYSASAKIMVSQLSSDPKDSSAKATMALLATYRQLLLSDRVLTETISKLDTLPPELAGTPDQLLWPIILRKMLTVSFEGEQQILEVSCRSTQPEATVSVIDALRTASKEFMDEHQKSLSHELSMQLQGDIRDVEGKLREVETKLLNGRRQSKHIAVHEGVEESHPDIARVSQLNQQLTALRTRRLELESILNSARLLVAQRGDLTGILTKLSTIVGENVMERIPGLAAANTARLDDLRSTLQTMESQLTALRRHYGTGHSEIIRRQSEIANQRKLVEDTQAEIRQTVQSGIRDPGVGAWLVRTLESEVLQLTSHEESLQLAYNDAETKALQLSHQLAGLEHMSREVQALSELRTSLLTRLNSIDFQDQGEVRVTSLSDPLEPTNPSYPILSHIMGLFCVVAAAIGVGVIYVMDLMDDRLRSPEEVREELGLPVLGIIRKLPEHEVAESVIYVHDYPQTSHAECFRTLKTALTLSPLETKCLAVTSTEASEGKTTTTVNLAASYAQTGRKTLLIDADMRRPGLSRLLDVRSLGGLSEVLRAEQDVASLCRERKVTTDVELLDVLPCGPRSLNPGMLLSMPALSDVLAWATSEYDQVIVDCPPTLPVSDAAIVGRYVDGLLFVMNPDKTHRRSVARAVDQLRSMELKIVGVVANTSLSEDNSTYGYQYGYGYSAEYSYGHDDELDGDAPFGPPEDETSRAA